MSDEEIGLEEAAGIELAIEDIGGFEEALANGAFDDPDVVLIHGPPEEPEPPSMDNPPGDWTEYSDTPQSYRLLRLSRNKYSAEEAAVRSDELCGEWDMRKYGEGFFDSRWWCWRCV